MGHDMDIEVCGHHYQSESQAQLAIKPAATQSWSKRHHSHVRLFLSQQHNRVLSVVALNPAGEIVGAGIQVCRVILDHIACVKRGATTSASITILLLPSDVCFWTFLRSPAPGLSLHPAGRNPVFVFDSGVVERENL